MKNKKNLTHPYLNDSSKACVQFSSKEKALEVQKMISNSKFKGNKIVAFISTDLKGHRLIVSNLPFNCTEGSLFEKFKEFGDLLECLIPRNEQQKSRGFAILQFATKEAAAKCLPEMNAKKLSKREIAIDWCLPKHAYQTTMQSSAEQNEEETDAESELSEEEEKETGHQDSDVSVDEMSEVEDKDDFFNLNDDCEPDVQHSEEHLSAESESDSDCFEPLDEESEMPVEVKEPNLLK